MLLLAGAFAVSARALALGTEKPLKQYGRQSWESDTGLPQNTIPAVLQTNDGYIWMASEAGLSRFDGQEFRTFDQANTPELPSNSINSLTLDSKGTLWISTSGGLVRREGGRFASMTTADGLPSNMVRFVLARRGGGVLVATSAGLAVGDSTGFHTLPGLAADTARELLTESAAGTIYIATAQRIFALPAGSSEPMEITTPGLAEIHTIAAGPSSDLWIGGRSGLTLLRNGRNVPIDLRTLANLDVTSLLPLPGGDLWIGTAAGLFVYTHGALKRIGPMKGATSGRVLRLFADREGSVWAAFDLSVSRVANGTLQDAIDLPGVLSIFEDREGDMWFGTDVGGATVLREQAVSTLTTRDGLSDDFVRAVFQDHAGSVWLGTNRGGLNRIRQGKVSALRAGKGAGDLSSNVVLALAESGHDMWIGTPDGLSRMHDGQLKLFTTADGLPDDFVRSLYTDKDGSLWIGTRNGLSHYAHGVFTSFSRLDGLGSDLIGSILRGRDGTLWVGTLNGLSRFDGTSFHNLATKDGLGGDAITTIAEDHAGTLWIASHASGLTRVRPHDVPRLAGLYGFTAEIYSILEAATPQDQTHPSLWLGTSKGIFRVSLDALNAFLDDNGPLPTVESFGTAEGMKISECSSGGHPAAWRMADGTLWFATLRGADSIDPASAYESNIAPLTSIEELSIDNLSILFDTVPGDRVFTVPPDRDRVSVHYAGLSFRSPQKLRFRYKLEGFDQDWVYAASRRTAFYTNLPAGRYRFVVYASNGDGVWSEIPGELQLTIQPHFYRTIWFYCLVLLFSALLAWLIYRARVRTVEAQYQAVLAERNRIAREIHDTLAQGYVGISVQLEVASRLLQVSREATAQQLEKTKDYVRSSLAEARSSIWNLRSPGADSDTLPARLAAAVESRQQPERAAPSMRFDVHGSFRAVDRKVEDEVLRIGQEALANALRHAAATAIAVVLSYDTEGNTGGDKNWLKLTVTDDGKGFVPANVPAGHFGLQGMHERAQAIGALLRLDSSAGKGTTVELRYKLPEQAEQARKEP